MVTPPPRCGQTNKVKLLPSRRTTYAGGNKEFKPKRKLKFNKSWNHGQFFQFVVQVFNFFMQFYVFIWNYSFIWWFKVALSSIFTVFSPIRCPNRYIGCKCRLWTWMHYLLDHTSGLALNTIYQRLTSFLVILKNPLQILNDINCCFLVMSFQMSGRYAILCSLLFAQTIEIIIICWRHLKVNWHTHIYCKWNTTKYLALESFLDLRFPWVTVLLKPVVQWGFLSRVPHLTCTVQCNTH